MQADGDPLIPYLHIDPAFHFSPVGRFIQQAIQMCHTQALCSYSIGRSMGTHNHILQFVEWIGRGCELWDSPCTLVLIPQSYYQPSA